MKEDEVSCVWYNDMACPIRTEMRRTSILDKIKPPKRTDDTVMVEAYKSVLKETVFNEWMFLPQYCQMCQKRTQRQMEESRRIREELSGAKP